MWVCVRVVLLCWSIVVVLLILVWNVVGLIWNSGVLVLILVFCLNNCLSMILFICVWICVVCIVVIWLGSLLLSWMIDGDSVVIVIVGVVMVGMFFLE